MAPVSLTASPVAPPFPPLPFPPGFIPPPGYEFAPIPPGFVAVYPPLSNNYPVGNPPPSTLPPSGPLPPGYSAWPGFPAPLAPQPWDLTAQPDYNRPVYLVNSDGTVTLAPNYQCGRVDIAVDAARVLAAIVNTPTTLTALISALTGSPAFAAAIASLASGGITFTQPTV